MNELEILLFLEVVLQDMISNVTAWPWRKEAQMRHGEALYVVLEGIDSMSCVDAIKTRSAGLGRERGRAVSQGKELAAEGTGSMDGAGREATGVDLPVPRPG